MVFPVLHGPFGEDGTIQGLLEMAGVPYVGAGVLASAAGMDKEFTKKLLAADGLPVGDLVVLRPGTATLTDEQRDRLGPAGVRQARPGRIVGRDHPGHRLGRARRRRRHRPRSTTRRCWWRRRSSGARWSAACWSSPTGRCAPACPPRSASSAPARRCGPEFYDFEAKYLDDVCEFDIPAKLDDAVSERLRELAVAAFRALDGQGLARVDFFVGPAGELTVNEVNTMPGFTPISMYPRAWAVTGVDYPTLLTTLVETALARGIGPALIGVADRSRSGAGDRLPDQEPVQADDHRGGERRPRRW